MLRHVTLSASSFDASVRFYDAALGALGLARTQEYGDEEEDAVTMEAAGFGQAGEPPMLWLVTGPPPSRGAHVAITASSRGEVDAFFAAALACGGAPRRPPRRWAIYRPGYYGAVVADPDGNLVEAVSDE